jgi:hypothetical protein
VAGKASSGRATAAVISGLLCLLGGLGFGALAVWLGTGVQSHGGEAIGLAPFFLGAGVIALVLLRVGLSLLIRSLIHRR